MNWTRIAPLGLILLSGATAAAPPASPAPAAPKEVAKLHAGDTVRFELSSLPEVFEGEGSAVCVGTRIAATGPETARCERPYRFEVPVQESRMTYTFRGAKGGESRIDLPITRAAKPVTFVAPSDGSLLSPAPTQLPEQPTDVAARKAAEQQCVACEGKGFTLESFEVTRRPGGEGLPVRIAITPAPRPTPAPR
jgi:hypothetical protein